MASYDSKPSIYEANGDGSFTYRWDIKEVQKQTEDTGEPETQWECEEVIVWATVTRSKLTTAVLTALWDGDYEAKLINDYNAAKEGVFSEEESARAIEKYKNFLADRKTIKEQIKEDCKTLKIPE